VGVAVGGCSLRHNYDPLPSPPPTQVGLARLAQEEVATRASPGRVGEGVDRRCCSRGFHFNGIGFRSTSPVFLDSEVRNGMCGTMMRISESGHYDIADDRRLAVSGLPS
jgi:hypothetical protein